MIGLPITGFGYGEGEGIHSPNEFLKSTDPTMKIDSFFTSLEAAVRLYHNLGEITPAAAVLFPGLALMCMDA